MKNLYLDYLRKKLASVGTKESVKLYIICPKCLYETNRWIMSSAIWHLTDRNRLELQEVSYNERMRLEEFEHTVLNNHICNYNTRV